MSEIPLEPAPVRLPFMLSDPTRKDARVSVLLNQRWRSLLQASTQGQRLIELLREPSHDIEAIAEVVEVQLWIAKLSHGRVTVDETDRLRLDGALIDYGLTGRIGKIVRQGVSFTSLANFIERLSRNPDKTVAEDLYRFMEKGNLPLDEDGYLYGFKKVDDAYWSYASGTDGKVQYLPETSPSMPREDCDPNRQRTCSRGLHVCSFEYLKFWYPRHGRVLIIRIDPEHVTAIPADHDDQKLRCCELYVAGEIPEEDAKEHFKDIVDNRYRAVEAVDDIIAAVEGVLGSEDVEEAPAGDDLPDEPIDWNKRGFNDGKENGEKDAALGYAKNPAEEFTYPTDIPDELVPREAYFEGYEEGYVAGYDGEPWTLERALVEGKANGVAKAKSDYPIYANVSDNGLDNFEDEAREGLITFIETAQPELIEPDKHPFAVAYDRAFRDAYHTHFNSKADLDD